MAANTALEKQEVGELSPAEFSRGARQYCPNVDIVENTEELAVLMDVPGVSPEDIDIRFEQGTLTITGRARNRQPESTRYRLWEHEPGVFHRSFTVSEAVDATRIGAECADGVLTVHLPKVEAAKPQKITVRAAK